MKCQLAFFVINLLIFTLSSQKLSEDVKSELFYQEVNQTIRGYSRMYIKRVNCIIKTLKKENVVKQIHESSYTITFINNSYEFAFVNHTEMMEMLEPVIASARLSCTIVGFCAIFLICTVLLVLIICVACLYK